MTKKIKYRGMLGSRDKQPALKRQCLKCRLLVVAIGKVCPRCGTRLF